MGRDARGRFIKGSGGGGKGLRDIDHGAKALQARLEDTSANTLIVGIFEADGSKGYTSGGKATVLDVAMWNEFGTKTIPPRSFIRAWFDENADKCREAARLMLEGVVAGKYSKRQACELLAQRFVAEIQKRIAGGISPPNAPSTVDRKGSSTPLIDTGQLRSSITYQVK